MPTVRKGFTFGTSRLLDRIDTIQGVVPVGEEVTTAREILDRVRAYSAPKVTATALLDADIDSVDALITDLTIRLAAQDEDAVRRACAVALSVAEQRLRLALEARSDV